MYPGFLLFTTLGIHGIYPAAGRAALPPRAEGGPHEVTPGHYDAPADPTGDPPLTRATDVRSSPSKPATEVNWQMRFPRTPTYVDE